MVTQGSPSRLLLILGEYDLPTVQKGSAFIFEQASGISLPAALPLRSWSNADQSKKLVVLPWTDHTSTVLRPEAFEQIRQWLPVIYPQCPLNRESPPNGLLLRLSLCGVLLWLLVLVFNVSANLIDILPRTSWHGRISEWPEMPGHRKRFAETWQGQQLAIASPLSDLWAYALGGLLAVSILSLVNPWNALNLMGGGFLTGFLCWTGVFRLVLMPPRLLLRSLISSDLLKIIPAWGFAVFLAGPEITRSFAHLTLSFDRAWRIPWISASVFPFFLMDEWATRREFPGIDSVNRWLFHLSSRCILALALMFGFFVLKNGEFLIILILPALLALSTLCWVYSRACFEKTNNLGVSTLLSALLAGWFVGAFFAQL
jgi:hypothetical protein